MGQLLPHFNDIDVEPIEEPLRSLGEERYCTWPEVTHDLLNPQVRQREEEKELPPLIQMDSKADVELPPAPSGKPPLRKKEGSMRLPEPVAGDVPRHAEEQDKALLPQTHDHHESSTQMLEEERSFPTLGGGGTFSS